MIGVLTHHWAKLDCVGKADLVLKGNGIAQSKATGFVDRKTMYSLNDETQITSLVIWENEEIYEKWRASPERANAMAGADSLWSKPPESDRFRLAE